MTPNFFAYFSFWHFFTLLDLVGGKCNTTPVNKPVLKPKPVKRPVVKPKPVMESKGGKSYRQRMA
jgi:hypothetical protein